VAEAALRAILKDLREHGGKRLEHFKDFLALKAVARRKAAELAAAQANLAGHDNANGKEGVE
jgi:hypothetical protein